MPDYVYALHDFLPELDDELTFKAGERIEVIERDDQYHDGWWQGRSLSGQVGLFPQAYTTPSQPGMVPSLSSSGTPLQRVEEEADGAVMAATLTDVQQAIEQLGGTADNDGTRSFTFSSSHGDTTDKEMEEDSDIDPDDWHKGARELLEKNAIREMAKRRSEEKQPPIQLDLSDESEPEEDDEYRHTGVFNPHRRPGSLDAVVNTVHTSSFVPEMVPEEDEDDHIDGRQAITPGRPLSMASLPTPTSPHTKFPDGPPTATLQQLAPQPAQSSSPELTPGVTKGTHITHSNHETRSLPSPAPSSSGGKPSSIVTHTQSPSPTNGDITLATALSSRTRSTDTAPTPVRSDSTRNSTTASSTIGSQPSVQTTVTEPTNRVDVSRKSSTHPSEWTVDQVVEWLQSKGFDSSITEKFIEHEISGDVLLELDATSIKELDIHAFGKRKKIENAIIELRRPPSINSSAESTRNSAQLLPTHQRQPSYQPSNSVMLNSPQQTYTPISMGVMSSESPPHTGDMPVSPASEGHQRMRSVSENLQAMVDQDRPRAKGKPVGLTLSPSEGALRAKAIRDRERIPEEIEEEPTALSDGETRSTPDAKSRRRHIFRRSQDSSSSKAQSSPRDAVHTNGAHSSLPGSPFHVVTRRDSQDDKSTRTNGKGSERLSMITSAIIKPRSKPSTRMSTGSNFSDDSDKATGLGRFLPSSRKSSQRPVSDEPSRDTTVLRKRGGPSISSISEPRPIDHTSHTSQSHQLQRDDPNRQKSILEQIGHPDHAGWLRKKGERYNTWKLRYLVLKGSHLYYLRNDSKTETKVKGYINIQGYKVLADENVNPGRYGFRIIHDAEKPHFFSFEDKLVVREWMKALMKATIDRDYSKPVISSCNIPTIPLTVAQAMNPAPRPPSPGARDATQKALRRENPNQLSTRDAEVLMGLPISTATTNGNGTYLPDRADVESLYGSTRSPEKPARPSRDTRHSRNVSGALSSDPELIAWANNHLPDYLQFTDETPVTSYGLSLFRLAEAIRGESVEPPVSDNAFPTHPGDERLDGLFRLFDLLLDEGVRMGSVSINDVRQGNPERINQLLKGLRQWEEKQQDMSRRLGPAVGGYNPVAVY